MENDNIVKLAALHRHWIVADAVRVVLKQKTVTPIQEEEYIKKFGIEYVAFGEHASMICRMQVWYSLLYVVIEGYQELLNKFPDIRFKPLDEVLAVGEYVDLLRRFRNATFHFQADPLNAKLIDFLEKKDSEVWIGDLNRKLSAFFIQALPIKEAMEKMEKEGVPEIPVGTKLETLIGIGKK
ncbi:hypothetical protein [Massilia sp. Root351]|uniref:hypothetical protein n=1 Tax=Massilia sp. Root351 TaxID=1736522 RepID=UPI0009E95F97|nr:hypothetical protein [Massilia sp. Root351]